MLTLLSIKLPLMTFTLGLVIGLIAGILITIGAFYAAQRINEDDDGQDEIDGYAVPMDKTYFKHPQPAKYEHENEN